jgi:hypothetical protein
MRQQGKFNAVNNNFLEEINFNYSCIALNNLGGCRQNYVMTKVHTPNSLPNILLCSLKTKDVVSITNYYKTIKIIKIYKI